MIKNNNQAGFTVVELLISLFIAAAFLLSGYQLFNVAVKDSGESRTQSIASNSAYEYLQRYKPSATNPCSSTITGLPTNLAINTTGLANAKITVTITCPYASVTSISKITSTIQYGSPIQTISIATYVKP